MHEESFYQFILYTLLREGKSNIPFKLKVILLGKRYASRRYFMKLFKGCDISSFMNLKEEFEKDHSQYSLDMQAENIKKDGNGLMTGECCL